MTGGIVKVSNKILWSICSGSFCVQILSRSTFPFSLLVLDLILYFFNSPSRVDWCKELVDKCCKIDLINSSFLHKISGLVLVPIEEIIIRLLGSRRPIKINVLQYLYVPLHSQVQILPVTTPHFILLVLNKRRFKQVPVERWGQLNQLCTSIWPPLKNNCGILPVQKTINKLLL